MSIEQRVVEASAESGYGRLLDELVKARAHLEEANGTNSIQGLAIERLQRDLAITEGRLHDVATLCAEREQEIAALREALMGTTRAIEDCHNYRSHTHFEALNAALAVLGPQACPPKGGV